MSRRMKIGIIVTVDSVLILIANLFSYVYMKPFVRITTVILVSAFVIQWLLYLIFGSVFNVFKRINRYTSLKELVAIFSSLVIAGCLELTYFVVINDTYSQRYIFLTYLVSMFLISSSRVGWRVIVEIKNSNRRNRNAQKNTIIVGAGAGGNVLLNTLNTSTTYDELHVVGFVDDDKEKIGTVFYGSKVFGSTEDLPNLIEEHNVDNITIAIPSLRAKDFERILDIISESGVTVNSMPSIEQIVNGDVSVTKLRDVDVVDLLGREEVVLDISSISTQLTNKIILVTGAGGSIGSEICRQVSRFTPKKLILLGHGENSIYLIEKELRKKFDDKEIDIVPVIADIQDRERIFEVVSHYQPDIIYHAAAHKHVPLMEYNPIEAVKNNIYGTKNVAEAAKKYKVKSFVMISTDKANNPPNVMGSTKRISEMLVTGLNEEGCTKFSAVRFGNVLGSRGSVVPLFKEQIEAGGPVTVTDMRMTRYFMTIPEASRLVIQSGALANGGEIFILDMGDPVKISDLAKKMIKLSGYTENEIEIVESGIRPGEKLYEELLVDKEKSQEQIYNKIFVGNISGYGFDEAWQFVKELPTNENELAKELIRFANESSEM